MVCVFVAVYPGCEPFIDEYIGSLSRQSEREFGLLVISDGLDVRFIKEKLEKAGISDYEILPIKRKSTIAEKREYGLRHILEKKYKKILLTDIDDTYSVNRIEILSEELHQQNFAIHDFLVEVGNERHSVLRENGIPACISFEFLLRLNVAGFGNSGINREIVKDVLPIPEDIIAVDWWIAALSSILHGEIAFLNKPLMEYRQHSSNLIGMSRGTNSRKIRLGLRVKRIHYRRLRENTRIPKVYRDLFGELRKETEELEKKIADPEKMNQYVAAVNQYLEGRIPMWWEDVVPPHLLGVTL